MIALLLACRAGDPATPEDDVPPDPLADPFLGGDCSARPTCADCGVSVPAIDHAPWFNRLTESPPLSVTTLGSGDGVLQVAFGSAPGTPDVWCWEDVPDAGSPFQVRSLWLEAGETVFAMARWKYADGTVSPAVDSAGWTVDIVPPEAVGAVESHRAISEHRFGWTGGGDDDRSGFSHYEAALGSLPGASDLVDWTSTDAASTFGFDLDDVPVGQWGYPSARTVDAAGNASLATTGEGFIRCVSGYVFVPANDDPGIDTDGFCVEKYEAKILGEDDGDQGWSDAFVEEARVSGTPWASVERGFGSIACAAHGMQYTLISNKRWQALARDLEATGENWSGGAVGAGALNRGHCDGDPYGALEASTDDDPCFGTNNPACDDPTSPDWGAKRTHALSNGEVVWDVAGNIWEHVDGALALDANGLWTAFDAAVFTTDAGWEDRRANFGPAGDFTTEHGVGQFYLGSGELLRGGSFASGDNPNSGGSDGEWDSGLYNGHHNVWWDADGKQGFRCVYSP